MQVVQFKTPVNEEIVQQLEEALELAREGKIRLMVFAIDFDDNVLKTYLSEGDMLKIIGMVDRLRHRANKVLDANECNCDLGA